MPDCPTCHQTVDSQAVNCPYCRTALKAHGHPGIPLYRASGETALCQTCLYDHDDTCTYPQRPHARECTLYNNQITAAKTAQHLSSSNRSRQAIAWFKTHSVWFWLAGLGGISLLLALKQQSGR